MQKSRFRVLKLENDSQDMGPALQKSIDGRKDADVEVTVMQRNAR